LAALSCRADRVKPADREKKANPKHWLHRNDKRERIFSRNIFCSELPPCGSRTAVYDTVLIQPRSKRARCERMCVLLHEFPTLIGRNAVSLSTSLLESIVPVVLM